MEYMGDVGRMFVDERMVDVPTKTLKLLKMAKMYNKMNEMLLYGDWRAYNAFVGVIKPYNIINKSTQWERWGENGFLRIWELK